MKRNFIVIICFLVSAMVFAQEGNPSDSFAAEEQNNTSVEGETSSESKVSYNGSSYNIMFSWKKKANNPHWTGVGMAMAGLNGLSDAGADLRISTSYTFVVNPIDYCIPLDYHWLLVSGAGIDWTRYHFKDNMGVEEVDGITRFVQAPEGMTYKSSKLLAYYITIPLLLEYQTKVSKGGTFFVSGGFVGYIKCYSKSQVDIYTANGVDQVNKGRDLNILPVNGRAMLQAGIGDVCVYAYYSPFSLFEKGDGPDVKPVGIGIRFDF